MEQDSLRDNFIQELRRGVIILAVLGSLREEQYGYSILKSLSDQGLDVDQGTLYPLLRRLETQGLLNRNGGWKKPVHARYSRDQRRRADICCRNCIMNGKNYLESLTRS